GGGVGGGGGSGRRALLPPPPQAVSTSPTATASSERLAPAGKALPPLYPFIDALPIRSPNAATYTASRPRLESAVTRSVMNASAGKRDCPRFAAGQHSPDNQAIPSPRRWNSTMSDIVILGAKRTAIGSFLGQFNGVPTPALGEAAIRGALEHAGLAPDQVDETIMGCVLPAGLGQAPARQASRAAGIPDAAGCTTINKVCGSGMKAAMLGHDMIRAGSAKVVVAGGMESMTNAPHLLNGSRNG